MAATGKVLGTVTSIVGEVKATAADGTVRILQVGDQIHADETINTGTLGSLVITLSNGATMDCGANTDLAMSESMLGVASAVTAPTSGAATDVAALQAAIAAGQDPSKIAEATAAGGAPAAGGALDGGSHSPVIIEQSNSAGVVAAGFTTTGAGIGFPAPEFELVAAEPQPTVGVQPVPPSAVPGAGGSEQGVVISGQAVGVIEGTNGIEAKIVAFLVSLSSPYSQPVTVTYQILEGTATTPSDFYDGPMTGTATIPAGATEFFVTVSIVQDHFVEGNETFRIELTGATNATINQDADAVVVTIIDDDFPPLANADAYTTAEDTPLTIAAGSGVLTNDTGAESNEVLTVTGNTSPSHGTVTLNPDGSFTYTPNADYNGPDSFQYSMTDGFNGTSTATVSINVTPVNDPPVAANDGYSTNEDTALVIPASGILVNDTDVEGDALSSALVQGPQHGTLTLNADGSFTYTPAANYNGPDSFTYKANDGSADSNVATVNITVNPVNDAPVINAAEVKGTVYEAGLADGSQAGEAPIAVSGAFTVSDVDGDTISLSQIQFSTNGGSTFTTVAVSGSSGSANTGHGVLTLASLDNGATWTWTYTLNDNVDSNVISGDQFKVSVTDGSASASTDVFANITIADDVPQARDDSVVGDEDQTVTYNVLANDSSGADVAGTVVAATLATANAGTVSFAANGNVTFTPATGFQGPATINYTMQDSDGDQSSATLVVTVGPDSKPQITAAADSTVDETGGLDSVTASLVASFGADVPGTIALSAAGATWSAESHTLMADDSSWMAVDNQNGTYTFTQLKAMSHPDGTNPDDGIPIQITAIATDSEGDATSRSFTVTVKDDGPTAANDVNAIAEDAVSINGNVLTNDASGADAPASFVSWASTTANYGTFTDDGNGGYTYALNNSLPAVQGLSDGQSLTETLSYTMKDADGDTSQATLTITINGTDDGVTITGIGSEGGDETVYEKNLATGSASDSLALVQDGSFAIVAKDGIASVQVGAATLSLSQLLNLGSSAVTVDTGPGKLVLDGYTGTAAGGTVHYTYTLQDPTVQPAAGADSSFDNFAVTVTDKDGSAANSTLSVRIVDDVPAAAVDSGSATEGLTSTVVAASGVLANDTVGADAGGTVVGVAAGNTNANASTGAGSAIAGAHGTLTIAVDGSYSYLANGSVNAGLQDVFTYTMKDADGDLSHATLTITFEGDRNTPSAQDSAENQILEALLPGGSDQGADSNTVGGTVTFSYGGDGAGSVALVSGQGTYGTMTMDAQGAWTYTLSGATTDLAGPETDSFTYVVTDSDGSTATGKIVVTIVDDVPTAVADSGAATEGLTSTVAAASGVLTNDTVGADAGGAVVGVAAGNTGANASTGVGTAIAGAHGTLTLDANGGYSYVANGSVNAGLQDVFTYTMRDADGDLSHATLTITFEGDRNTPSAQDSAENQILESFLPGGSDPGADSNTVSGTVTFSYGGDGAGSVALVSGQGTYGTMTMDAQGAWTYTLSGATTDLAGPETDSFTYVVTDSDGSTATGKIVVTIVDDVPTAVADSGAATEGLTSTVAAASGVLTNDTVGADAGGAVVGVVAGNTNADATTGVDAQISGAYGKLTLHADGSYSYVANSSVNAGLQDVFTYTMKDADGDLSHATLTITFEGDGNVPTAQDAAATIQEALLPGGSDPSADSNTVGGTVTFSYGGDGAGSVALVSGQGTYGTMTMDAQGDWTYTLNGPVSHAAGGGANTALDTFTYKVTDSDGTSVTSEIKITIVDDVPTLMVNDIEVNRAQETTNGSGVFVAGADGGAVDAASLLWTNKGTFDPEGNYTFAQTGPSTWSATFENASNETQTFFNITMNADGTYAFELVTPSPLIPSSSGPLLSGVITGGSNLPEYIFSADKFNGAFELRLTATDNRTGADTLTISSTELGINGNSIQEQFAETLILDVLQQPGYETASITSLTLGLASTGSLKTGDKFTMTVHYASDGNDNTLDVVTTNPAYLGGGTITFDVDPTRTVDYVTLTPESNNMNFKITGLSLEYTQPLAPSDQLLTFQVSGVDGDMDKAPDGFSVNLIAGTSDNDTLVTGKTDDSVTGGLGDDVINTGAGNDILVGGEGNDVLTGGTGSDTFKFTGSLTSGNADKITDFTVAPVSSGGDVLDLHDVLPPLAQGQSSLTALQDYIKVSAITGSTVISVDLDGTGGDAAVQVVTLQNVTGVTLQMLLDNHQIIT